MELSQPSQLAYVFAAFVVGTASASGALVLARVRRDHLASAFLVLYLPLTALVFSALLLVFFELRTGSPNELRMLDYAESFLGRYVVMLGLPLCAHRVFGVRTRLGDALIISIVLTMFLFQHLTEFALGGRWDRIGDGVEDVVFAGIVGYSVWLGISRWLTGAVHLLGTPLVAVLLLGLPVAAHDIFFVDGPGTRWYPFWYAALGPAAVGRLLGRGIGTDAAIPPAWGLTAREKDVVRLVRLGLSNDAIAERLYVSPNTVKTHLRSIFDKSGVRSRVVLIATMAAQAGDENRTAASEDSKSHHPIG